MRNVYRAASHAFHDHQTAGNAGVHLVEICISCHVPVHQGKPRTALPPKRLAWLLSRGEHIVPIPGTKRRTSLEGSMATINVALTNEDIVELDVLADKVSGECYAKDRLSMTRR